MNTENEKQIVIKKAMKARKTKGGERLIDKMDPVEEASDAVYETLNGARRLLRVAQHLKGVVTQVKSIFNN